MYNKCILIFISFCSVFKDAVCTSVSEVMTELVTMNNVMKAAVVRFKELSQHQLDGLRKPHKTLD